MKRILCCLCAITLAACSGNDAPGTNNGADDAGNDVSQSADLGSAVRDMPSDPDAGSGPLDLGTDATAVDATTADADAATEPDLPAQECFHPSTDPNCPMGAFGPAAFLDTVVIAEDRTCCRDFDGDGNMDNTIGEYMAVLKNGGNDMNAQVAGAIQAGQLVYLLEFANWSNETADPSLDMRLFLGSDSDSNFDDNLAGTGDFLVTDDSYEMDGTPKWVFTTSSVRNGRLLSEGGALELAFPGLLDEVRLLVTDVRIEADVVPPADLQSGGRVVLANGELSGALNRDVLFSSMNEASAACECLGKPAFVYSQAEDKWLCDVSPTESDRCQFDTPGCRSLTDQTFCNFFQFASGDVDVDTDGDGNNDSFSLGTRFTAVGASITGRQLP